MRTEGGTGLVKKTGKVRSRPNIEYSLEDATAEEKKLIKEGTITDRINTLTLLCVKNPTTENYKQLLFFTQNQRNDVIYLVLKNLRDLLKEEAVKETYIKNRIIKSYEMGMKNQYIKEKVIEIVAVLVRAGIYEEELIMLLVERLGEKDEALKRVQEALRSVFPAFEEMIFQHIEDFYYKNDNFRLQYLVLKFLRGTEPCNKSIHFEFYDQALTALDETYAESQRALMMGQIIGGLARCFTDGSKITQIGRIRECFGTAELVGAALELLIKTKDERVDSFVLRAAKRMSVRGTEHEPVLLNGVERIFTESLCDGKDLLVNLINSCFYYTDEYIASLLILGSKRGVGAHPVHWILARHSSPVVRDLALRVIRREKVAVFDPYDRVAMENRAIASIREDI